MEMEWMGINTFQKVSVIARLESELTYLEAAVLHFIHQIIPPPAPLFVWFTHEDLVAGDPKAPFSIATTPRCREGRYSIPSIAPLYYYRIVFSAKQSGIK